MTTSLLLNRSSLLPKPETDVKTTSVTGHGGLLCEFSSSRGHPALVDRPGTPGGEMNWNSSVSFNL